MSNPLTEQPPASADQLLNAIRQLISGGAAGASASNAQAVTPSDVTVLENCRALYVGTGGDVVATVGGQDVTFVNVPDGTWLPVMATKVKAATTASDIVRLW